VNQLKARSSMRLLLLPAVFGLVACQASNADNNSADVETNVAAPAAPAPPSAPAPPTPALETPGASTPDSEKSAEAALKVLQGYFDALATKRYGDAYRMWNGNGQATGMSEAEFAASFAKYRDYDGHAGKPGLTDGAAGSIYIEIPAQVTGVLAKGGGFVLEGPMTLKRVNDVDGSTAEQRRWYIQSSGLKPRP
jgi:hypothetical protein